MGGTSHRWLGAFRPPPVKSSIIYTDRMNMRIKTLCLLAGTMALLAIIPTWPYSYYILLRWVLAAIAIVLIWKFHELKHQGWALAFVAIGILFNPLLPVYLNRSIWSGIDLVTSIAFFASFQKIKK